MRSIINILSLLTLLVVLSADNCSGPDLNNKQENNGKQIPDTYQHIENEFIKNELSIKDLDAFEKRAIQKLRDIADYISINADSAVSVLFRKQANHMIRENFIEKDDVSNFYKNLEIREDTLNTILYHLKYESLFKTEFSSIEIIKRFQKESDLIYTGEIQFTQRISFLNQADTVLVSLPQQINIHAIKTGKNFGSEMQDVWEVYFSEPKL